METLSHELLLDVPFTAEEVVRSIGRLKGRKAEVESRKWRHCPMSMKNFY